MNKKTPLEDLRKATLDHYDEAATSIFHHSSAIPKAINFYYDHLIAAENRKEKLRNNISKELEKGEIDDLIIQLMNWEGMHAEDLDEAIYDEVVSGPREFVSKLIHNLINRVDMIFDD